MYLSSCVPKKMTWNFASISETLKDGVHYGYDIPQDTPFNFADFKKRRDANIRNLNNAYERNWERENIELVRGNANFKSEKEIEVELQDGGKATYTAPRILIATGGHPIKPEGIKGAEYGITSDGFFDIEELPEKIAFVGAGYIAVELAGVMNAIGIETHMFIRGERFLRNFDPMIQDTLTKRYEDAGVKIHKNHKGFKEVVSLKDGRGKGKLLKLIGNDGATIEVNELLWAIGRAPEIETLNPAKVGVKQTSKGHIEVDAYQNTSVDGIYALGDVTGQAELTPGKLSYLSTYPCVSDRSKWPSQQAARCQIVFSAPITQQEDLILLMQNWTIKTFLLWYSLIQRLAQPVLPNRKLFISMGKKP